MEEVRIPVRGVRRIAKQREQSPEEKGEALETWLLCVLIITSLFLVRGDRRACSGLGPVNSHLVRA